MTQEKRRTNGSLDDHLVDDRQELRCAALPTLNKRSNTLKIGPRETSSLKEVGSDSVPSVENIFIRERRRIDDKPGVVAPT